MKLSEKQIELLNLVENNPGLCTAEIGRIRGDGSSYHSHLRDRLKRLEFRGLIESSELTTKDGGHVVKRTWFPSKINAANQ